MPHHLHLAKAVPMLYHRHHAITLAPLLAPLPFPLPARGPLAPSATLVSILTGSVSGSVSVIRGCEDADSAGGNNVPKEIK